MKRTPRKKFEPGLLWISRTVIVGFAVTRISLWLVWGSPGAEIFVPVYITGTVVILLLLSSHRLFAQMKQWRIPVAAASYMILILSVLWLEILLNLQSNRPSGQIIDTLRAYLIYHGTVVVVIVSTQYSIRGLLICLISLFIPHLILTALLPDSAVTLRKFLWVDTGGSVVFLFGIGYIITMISSTQRAVQAELNQKNIQLSDYAATAERLAVSHERNRIAREL